MAEKHDFGIGNKLGTILKQERIDRGLIRDVVAERVGISVRHLAAIENEERMPSADVLLLLIRALGISADLVAYPEKIPDDPEDVRETNQLIRLVRICDRRARRAARAMLEVLVYGDKSDEQG